MGKKRTKQGKPRKRVQGEDGQPIPDEAEIFNNELDKELEFEDPFEDEYEDEEIIDREEGDLNDSDDSMGDNGEVWDPRQHPLGEDEVLECDM